MSDPTHTDDYPRDVNDEAIKRAALLTMGAMNELRKMQSECLCWPDEWDDGEYVDNAVSLRDAFNGLETAHTNLLDIAQQETDLEQLFEPGDEQVAWFTNLVEASIEASDDE